MTSAVFFKDYDLGTHLRVMQLGNAVLFEIEGYKHTVDPATAREIARCINLLATHAEAEEREDSNANE